MHIIQTHGHTTHWKVLLAWVIPPSWSLVSKVTGYVSVCPGAWVSSRAKRERVNTTDTRYCWLTPSLNQTMQILHLNTPKESWMKMNMPNHPLYRVDSNNVLTRIILITDNILAIKKFSYLKFWFWDLFLNVSGVVSSYARRFFQFSLGQFSDGRKPFSAKAKIFNIFQGGFSSQKKFDN